ncbi:MAG: small basic protein [Candidatus Omnitrophica bacterium]|nr:small basic protein [Candidatus Omnitrophota bacterium]MCB9747706.1 small basic protein [Candidatus Omnitrophota bacterium]
MSIHPSLKIDTAGIQQRTVLTRIERIKDLMRKGDWSEGQNVTGLPKTKIVKVKARRKTKEEKEEEKSAKK